MHYYFEVTSFSKVKPALIWLKQQGATGIYSVEEKSGCFIGCFASLIGPYPPFLKLISKEKATVDWEKEWETPIKTFSIGKKNFKLKAGPGFGDASHPTTRLCLNALEKFPCDSVVDIGSGSGILSIAAFTLGIPHIIPLEIDPLAIAHHQENLKLNGISNLPVYSALPESVYSLSNPLILMNMILSEQKQVLSSYPELIQLKARWYISGILKEGFEEAKKFYEDLQLNLTQVDQLDQWLGFYLSASYLR